MSSGKSTVVNAGNKSCPMAEVRMQFSHSFLEVLWNGGCWVKMERHIRNMREFYDNLRWLIVLACLAFPSKDAKGFGLIRGLFQDFSSWGRLYLCKWYIQMGDKKFMRKIEVLKLNSVPGKQQPLLTFTVNLTVVWKMWRVTGWHCCSEISELIKIGDK